MLSHSLSHFTFLPALLILSTCACDRSYWSRPRSYFILLPTSLILSVCVRVIAEVDLTLYVIFPSYLPCLYYLCVHAALLLVSLSFSPYSTLLPTSLILSVCVCDS